MPYSVYPGAARGVSSAARAGIRLLPIVLWGAVQTALAAELSFGDALKGLWKSHPEVLKGEAALRAAGYDRQAAYMGYLPYLQVDMVSSNRTGNDDYRVEVVFPIWQGGLTPASVDSATITQAQVLADIQRTRLQLGLRLTEAYFSVLAYRDLEVQWRRYQEILNDLYGMIGRRAVAGASPQSDVASIVSRMRQAAAIAELNRAGLAAAEAQLSALLGGPIDDLVWPTGNARLDRGEADAAPARAQEDHPDLIYARAALSREEADSRVRRAGLSPEVAVRYIRPVGGDSLAEPETQLTVQYQTDNGLKALQGWRSGRQRVDAARAGVESARRDVAAAVHVAAAQWRASGLQLEEQAAAVSATDKVVESFLRQFEAGRKTWLEVLNAQREAHETRLALVEQKRNLWQSNARLALNGLYWRRMLPPESANDLIQGGRP